MSGVELTHPDKGTEMFLYELGVDESARGRGVGRALVEALAAVAREAGCYDMWVLADADNAAAHATYARAGGRESSRPVLLEWDRGLRRPLRLRRCAAPNSITEGKGAGAAVRGAGRRPQARAYWGCNRACFATRSGAAGVERRSYPLQRGEDRRSTAGRRKALRDAPEVRRNSAAPPAEHTPTRAGAAEDDPATATLLPSMRR